MPNRKNLGKIKYSYFLFLIDISKSIVGETQGVGSFLIRLGLEDVKSEM